MLLRKKKRCVQNVVWCGSTSQERALAVYVKKKRCICLRNTKNVKQKQSIKSQHKPDTLSITFINSCLTIMNIQTLFIYAKSEAIHKYG